LARPHFRVRFLLEMARGLKLFFAVSLLHAVESALPLIFDNDGNYDDILAFLYVAQNPLFDLKAITLEASGFATPHGGPPNMKAIAAMLGKDDVPVAYGEPQSLSPVATYPLQWRMELDLMIEGLYEHVNPGDPNKTLLTPQHDGISELSASDLILQILRESPEPVYILCTGPLTNLATALAKDPTMAKNIASAFLMGSGYKAPNNVYDWQLTYNGVYGGCAEAGNQDFTKGSMALHGLSPPQAQSTGSSALRPGCRGVNMTKHGRTEWNVFLDALAWQRATRLLGLAAVPVRVLSSNASLSMPIELEDMERHAAALSSKSLGLFVRLVAESFLMAGEAKWWDVHLAVAMTEELTGVEAVCQTWLRSRRTITSLLWRSAPSEADGNPYGSTIDDPAGKAPSFDFCVHGNVTRMNEVYWPMLNGGRPLGLFQSAGSDAVV